MLERPLFKCDLNCPKCEKECKLRIKPNKQEQSQKFDEVIGELNILNNNNVIESIQTSIDALKEDSNHEKLNFIKKCSREYIKDLAQNALSQDNASFIHKHFAEFIDYTANKILEDSRE